MSAITPDTDVILLKVPLEITQDNQLTFSNATAQYNYFHNLPRLELEDFTYQRKDGVIRCGILADDLYQYNYVMYRNNNFSSKWFYAFIDKVEYLNHNTSAIAIRTDVWQSWQFDLDYKPTFVEREHVNDDTIGLHTVPEGLETGEYICGTTQAKAPEVSLGRWICFQITEPVSNLPKYDSSNPRIYGGIYSGTGLILTDDTDVADLIVQAYDDAGKADSIMAVFYAPKDLINSTSDVNGHAVTLHETPCTVYTPKPTSTSYMLNGQTITRPTDIDGYTPKNNKLFVYPYSYLLVGNGTGSDHVYRWEDFTTSEGSPTNSAMFDGDGVLTQGCQIKYRPRYYKKGRSGSYGYNALYEVDCGVNVAKYPICSWNSDYYTNWQTQNAVNLATSIATPVISGAVSGAAAGAAGAAAGAATGLLSGILGVAGSQYQASLVPDQAKGNTNSGDLAYSLAGCQVYFQSMNVRNEYAKIIDNFFSMFGYKVNEVKVPNITGRTNWNYVKTIGCYIKADIPQEDLKEIKDMFNNGVTFWHNPATFADYSQNNAIVS